MKSGAQLVFNHSENGYIEKMLEEQPNGWLIYGLKYLLLVKKFGRIIIVGSRGTVQIDPRQAMIKDATIHGFINSNATDNVWICVNDC